MTSKQIIGELAQRQAAQGVKLGKMFGLTCLMLGRKPLVVLSGDELVFRIPLARTPEALMISGAYAWEPMPGRGRMKEWIVIPMETVDSAAYWANIALAFLHSKH
ncbi:MAG: hypothetical protein HPY76_06090 [Anaerolineae bacterium]|nr:hypothetical protein [Anaerolineae bacterium]